MKGAEEVPGIIGMVLIAIVAAGLLFLLIDFVFSNIIPLFAQGSAQVVSRDLAGLTTISGAAPYKITIHYAPTNIILYNVSIDSRILTVSILQSNSKPLTISISPYSQYSSSKIAVGDLKTDILNSKEFDIQKQTTISDQTRQSTYSVTGK
jgi:hypothetical protein